MEYSMYKTFACKYRTTKRKIIEKYHIDKDFGVRYTDWKGRERVRLFWKGSLARNDFPQEAKADTIHKPAKIKTNPSLADRLKAQTCEWCGRRTPDVVMHQVRALSELDDSQPWNIFMKKINAAMRQGAGYLAYSVPPITSIIRNIMTAKRPITTSAA